MPRRFRARRAYEIKAFLVANDYFLHIPRPRGQGDDDIYEKKGCSFPVKIPSRNNEEIPNGTMDYILKTIRKCGTDKKEVLKWWIDNGYRD